MDEQAVTAIQELVQQLQEAQSDVEAFIALHTAETVIVNFGGRRVLGREQLRAAMASALASPLAKVTTTNELLDIRFVRPDVAVVSCTKHVADERDTSETFASSGSLTYVVVHEDGGWRVALAQTTPISAS